VRDVERIGVVVPAKDEQRLLPACLTGLLDAARQVPIPVTVVVVLDSCSDRSATVVEAVRQNTSDVTVEAVVVTANSVGAARRAGMRTLLDRYSSQRPDGLWSASTDADSVVPRQWLRAQLAHAAAGARVVVGTITVTDWQERNPAVRDRAIAEYTATHHRHVHGANLSFTADAYQSAGGFPAQPFDEDVALVQAFTAAGEPIAWAVDLPVSTSARRKSRAPFGFAGYLDALESQASTS
jgi:cellulose synthase/poly-beta-1,6-N-acetylglucosamine synthase-like glycosyltransferase